MGGDASREIISTQAAPAAVGPYSQAVAAGGFLFTAGQIALDPATQKLVDGDVRAQTERVMRNLEAVLSAAGCGFADVVKTTIYLRDMADFATVNEVYGGFFDDARPARSTVAVSGLPLDARVEIDVVARRHS